MSHDIFKPSNLIGCLENKTADSAQTRKRAIVTRPFPLLEGGVWVRDYFIVSSCSGGEEAWPVSAPARWKDFPSEKGAE